MSDFCVPRRSVFGEVISTYTRAQAIEDGVLIDVTGQKGAEYFKVPCVLTASVHAAIACGQGKDADTYQARLWDVCYMSKFGRKIGDSVILYRVKVGRSMLTLRAECGPGDNAEPVMTIGFPEDF